MGACYDQLTAQKVADSCRVSGMERSFHHHAKTSRATQRRAWSEHFIAARSAALVKTVFTATSHSPAPLTARV